MWVVSPRDSPCSQRPEGVRLVWQHPLLQASSVILFYIEVLLGSWISLRPNFCSNIRWSKRFKVSLLHACVYMLAHVDGIRWPGIALLTPLTKRRMGYHSCGNEGFVGCLLGGCKRTGANNRCGTSFCERAAAGFFDDVNVRSTPNRSHRVFINVGHKTFSYMPCRLLNRWFDGYQ